MNGQKKDLGSEGIKKEWKSKRKKGSMQEIWKKGRKDRSSELDRKEGKQKDRIKRREEKTEPLKHGKKEWKGGIREEGM